ncbi:MAG: ABC transporter permease [Dongiaceae bacterium]
MSAAAAAAAAARRHRRRELARLALFFGPAALYALVFMVLPYANLLQFSVWRVENYAVAPDLTLANYGRVFANPLYLKVLGNSFQVAAIVTAAAVALGYPLALFVACFAGRSRRLLYFLVVIPLWTSFLLRAFIWRIILGREGVINSALGFLGLTDQPLSMLLFNRFSVCVALTYVFVPFVVLPVHAAIEKIPPELLEASLDLGAGPWRTLRRVILPLSLPGLLAGAVFAFCLSFGDFVAPTLLGGPSGLMISSVIINQFGAAFDWPFGSALAVITILVVGAAVLLVGRLERRAHA